MASNSFAAILENRFTRKWGGSGGSSVDPYITGFFFGWFNWIPKEVSDVLVAQNAPNDTHGLSSKEEIQNALTASLIAVTIPGVTVNKTDFTGMGGVRWSAPTSVEQGNDITLRFLEFQTLPITQILCSWTKAIRDYRTGTSRLPVYEKKFYTATMYYWTTRPNTKGVEWYACGTGMFPTKDPTDQHAADITAYDKLEIDAEFNCDYLFHENWVFDACTEIMSTLEGDAAKATMEYGYNGDEYTKRQ